jgi:hypothetical protein
MCQDCAGLVGGGRHTGPHAHLALDGPQQEVAADGMSANEQKYTCTACGQRWLHETGNSAYGWMVHQP